MTRIPTAVTDITCPFCGLLCDDLTVESDGARSSVTASGCSLAKKGFSQSQGNSQPTVDGKPATLELAVNRAARILRQARQPLIAGMATDAAGCRAAVALAEKSGAAVDHMHGPAISANVRVVQRRGWIMTTLTEVRNRADLVLLFGTDGDSVNPRFIERCLKPAPAMARNRRAGRKVAFVGAGAGALVVKKAFPGALTIPCGPQDYLEFLVSLRAVLGGHPELAGRRSAKLGDLVSLLRNSSYTAIVWAPGLLPPDHADLVIETLCELVSSLNDRQRAAGLALGGNDGAATALNVCTWQTGYPLRVNFAAGAPEYDPVRNGADSMMKQNQADAMVWISTMQPLPPPGRGNMPVIALAPPSRRLARLATVHIPVAIPGVDAAGTLFRLDGVVGLPLRQVRAGNLPTAADVLKRIHGCL